MGYPIPPKPDADEAVLSTILVKYNPTWDGADWALNTSIMVGMGTGWLVYGEDIQLNANVNINMDDLPQAAQDALQQLYGYFQQKLGEKYS